MIFHISPSTREEFPSAISAASMLTSFTCRRDHKFRAKFKAARYAQKMHWDYWVCPYHCCHWQASKKAMLQSCINEHLPWSNHPSPGTPLWNLQYSLQNRRELSSAFLGLQMCFPHTKMEEDGTPLIKSRESFLIQKSKILVRSAYFFFSMHLFSPSLSHLTQLVTEFWLNQLATDRVA